MAFFANKEEIVQKGIAFVKKPASSFNGWAEEPVSARAVARKPSQIETLMAEAPAAKIEAPVSRKRSQMDDVFAEVQAPEKLFTTRKASDMSQIFGSPTVITRSQKKNFGNVINAETRQKTPKKPSFVNVKNQCSSGDVEARATKAPVAGMHLNQQTRQKTPKRQFVRVLTAHQVTKQKTPKTRSIVSRVANMAKNQSSKENMLSSGLNFDEVVKAAPVAVVPPAMRTHIGTSGIEEPPKKRGKVTNAQANASQIVIG